VDRNDWYRMIVKRILKYILPAVLIFLFSPSWILAGLKVAPATIQVGLQPGGNYKTSIRLQNISREKEERFDIYLESIEKRLAKGSDNISMISWIKVSPTSLALSPGEAGDISIEIAPPEKIVGDFKIALIVDQSPYNLAPALPTDNSDVAGIQLGKHRRAGLSIPRKGGLTLIKQLSVGIPVYIRVQPTGLPKTPPPVRMEDLLIESAGNAEGALLASLLIENTGNFDLQVSGACRIFDRAKKQLLKITDLSGRMVVIPPKGKQLLKFVFSDPLPKGRYIASAGLKMKSIGFEKTGKKDVSAPLIIDTRMAARLKSLAGPGGMNRNTPRVPLLISPAKIDLNTKGRRIKPLTLNITNPTKKTLDIRSSFKIISQNKNGGKPQIEIMPERLRIKPGKSGQIRIKIGRLKNGNLYGNLLFRVIGMEASLPAAVPVAIVFK